MGLDQYLNITITTSKPINYQNKKITNYKRNPNVTSAFTFSRKYL